LVVLAAQLSGLEAGPVAFSGGLGGFDPSFEFPVNDTDFWSAWSLFRQQIRMGVVCAPGC